MSSNDEQIFLNQNDIGVINKCLRFMESTQHDINVDHLDVFNPRFFEYFQKVELHSCPNVQSWMMNHDFFMQE